MTTRDLFASAVLICKRSTSDIQEYVRNLHDLLMDNFEYFEIIIVSPKQIIDQSFGILEGIKDLSCLRFLSVSGKPSVDELAFAGLENAIGDISVLARPLIDPCKDVIKVFEILSTGVESVQGINVAKKSSQPESLARKLYFSYLETQLGISVPKGATYLVGFSRGLVNFATSVSRKEVYVRHIPSNNNFHRVLYKYEPAEHLDEPKRFKTSLGEAIESITKLSTHPLRVIAKFSFFLALANLGYIVFVVIESISNFNIAPGWTSTSLQISGMFLLVSLALGVLSEYIDRILKEIRAEPNFIVSSEFESEQMIMNEEKPNLADRDE